MPTDDLTRLDWRKATASADGACVELALLPDGGIGVRDSKNPAGPVLKFTRTEWLAFRDGLEIGEFNHLGTDSFA